MTQRLLALMISMSFCLLLSITSNAQRPDGNLQQITISGSIIDAESNTAMAYTTVSIFSKKDSSIVGGGISGDDGRFEIASQRGKLWIEIEFISYKTIIIEDFTLEKGKSIYDLGQIKMYTDGIALDEVQVTATKSTTQFSLDKRVFNVGSDLATRGGNAQDVLDNVPSVNVDVEGNVTLRGSGGVRILIDGKPSGLVGIGDANGLRNLPAELIEKVEVITNPSARYEAEGSTGIINIVLKKDKRVGFNGSFDFITGTPYKLGVGVNTNYTSGSLNFFLNYSIRDNSSPGLAKTYQENYFETQTRASFINRVFDRGGLSNTLRGGVAYSISDKSLLTFSGVYRKSDNENLGTTTYQDYFLPAGTKRIDRNTLTGADVILRPDDEFENEDNVEFSINFDKEIGKGHSLRSSITYQSQSEVESSELQELFANSNLEPLGEPYLFQKTRNDEGEKSFNFILDYVKPVGENGSMEAGFRSNIRSIGNDYVVQEQDDAGVFQDLAQFSNDFNYSENVHAGYFQYGNKINKVSYQMGLRAEYSRVITELVNTSEKNDRDYANLFPSLFLNYSFSETDGAQFSYSRRIRRPRFWYLNPFFGFSDPRNFYGGNPNLNPEFSDNFELGYLKYWDKASLTSSIYYRYGTGVIERIRMEDENDPSILITIPQNLATENNFGFEFVGSYRPAKWWRMDGNLNLYRSITEGTFGDIDLKADTYTWSGRATSRFTFWNKSDLQLRFNYRAGRQTTQGSSQGTGSTDIAFSKDFLGDNMTVTLNVRDLFNSRRRVSETITEDFYTDGFYQYRVRDISINFNYRLNMKKKKQSNRNSGGGEEFEGEF